MKNVIKVILINCAVLVCILILMDIVYGHHFTNGRTEFITCKRNVTNYDYCADISSINYMNPQDKFLPVLDIIGPDSRSIYKNKPDFHYDSNKGRLFLIGDSYIQADEMTIENRMGHHFRTKGIETFEIGYSSWNSFQYSRLVEKLDIKKGDKVVIFLMPNDFAPSYDRSVFHTQNDNASDEATFKMRWQDEFKQRSFVYNNYLRLEKTFNAVINPKKSVVPLITKSHDASNKDDCSVMSEALPASLLDYVGYAKSKKCWPADHLKSYEMNIDLIKKTAETVKRKEAQIYFVLVPAGWAFVGENTIGRMSDLYAIPSQFKVSGVGLSDALKEEIAKLKAEYKDLEPVLEKYNTPEENNLYFPADGHWNEKAHQILFDELFVWFSY